MDDGYCGSAPLYAERPGVIEANVAMAEMQQKMRNHQETVNKWFKAVLSTPCPHQLLEHQNVFGAIVVLTQLSLAETPLFQVDCSDD